jgi:hypothetical protein
MSITKKQTKSTKKVAQRAAQPAKNAAPAKPAKAVAPVAAATRTSKKDAVMALIQRADGASTPEIMEATGWQRHSVRGFLSILGKSLKIERSKEGRYSAK